MVRKQSFVKWMATGAILSLVSFAVFAAPRSRAGEPGEGVLSGPASPSTIVTPSDPQPPPPDADGDGVPIPQDCDDTNPNIHPAYPPNSVPAAPELCNGLDDNCNGQADETFPTLGDPCTAGVGDCSGSGSIVCNGPQTGVTCTAVAQPNGTACGSGSTTACTNPDTCLGGVCQGNHQPSGTACSDGAFCTTNDQCDGAGNCVPGPARDCSSFNITNTDFEAPAFTLGSINGQNGWSRTGAYDHEVSSSFGTAGFGAQSLRISNAVTSGSFGDMTFSASLPNEVGESTAMNGGLSGGVRKTHFESKFDIASTKPGSYQTDLLMSVSADRGDGARMTYLRFEDSPAGLQIFFDDYQDFAPMGMVGSELNGCSGSDDFIETQVGTNLSRAVPHTIRLTLDTYEGPANDVVKVYIDGALVHTGGSWEDYYRWCLESNPGYANDFSRTVDSLIFRTAGPAYGPNAGFGFLVDNLRLQSGLFDECNVGVCNESLDQCVLTPSNEGGACGSGTTTDCTLPDTCSTGVCAPNDQAFGFGCTTDGNDCTNDICNGTGTCTHPNRPSGFVCGSQSDTDCDNPNTCNGTGSCQANNEPSGVSCTSDGNQCTNDICDGTGSCSHPNRPSGFACGDPSDTTCTDPDTCNGTGGCQPNNAPNGTSCSDGNVCTTTDTCQSGLCSGGPPLSCDDSNSCTTDTCVPSFGFCGPLPAGQCPTGATQWCGPNPIDPTSSAQAKLACEACWGTTCYLETADCAGPGWGPNPPGAYSCGNAYFGYTSGCSGGPGRSWSICSSFTTYNIWATFTGTGGGCQHDPSCGLTGHVWYEKVVAGSDALDTAKPVKNATVNKSGAQTGSTTTNATGAYSFASLAGNLTFKPNKLVTLPQGNPNDWDLYLNGADASKIALFAVGSTTLTVDQKEAADVSDNGFVTSFDASQVATKVVNQAFVFPVRTNTGSDFAFFPISVSYTPMTGSQVADFGSILYGDVTENWVSPETFEAIEPPGRVIVSQSLANMGPLTVSDRDVRVVPEAQVTAASIQPRKPAVLYMARAPQATTDGHWEVVYGLMNADGILGLDLALGYDQAAVTVLSVNTAGLTSSFNKASNAVDGRLSVALFGVNELKGSGDFLVVRYDVTGAAGSQPFNVAAQANEGLIPLQWSSTVPKGPAGANSFDLQGD